VTDVPHFSLPFRFATPAAAVSEQDSLDEIADCVLAVLLCPRGFRVELPSFGLEDPTFSSPAPDLDAIREAVELWEPRATVLLDEHPDLLDELVGHVEVDVTLRTED
jgi:phage baseplate assembly protein W